MHQTEQPLSYDFRQAHNLSADQLRELGEHCVSLCRALQRYVPESTGLAARFILERSFSSTYDAYLDGLPESPVIAVCELGSALSPLIWQVDMAPLYVQMDAMLGGGGSAPVTTERELTVLERALVGQIVEEYLATWCDAWPALETVGPRVVEVRQTVGRFGSTSLQEPIMAVQVAYSIGEAQGVMRIALPTVVLRGLLKQTSSCPTMAAPVDVVDIAGVSEIGVCRVVATVNLARTRMTVRDLLALRVGDVVPLDRGPRDQLDIAIAGRSKFRGISGLVNGRLAVRVTERVEA